MPNIKTPTTARDQAHSTSVDASLNAMPATRVLRQFRIVFNAVKTHFRKVEANAGIGGAQLWALSVVHARPGIGVSDLAGAMDVHQSTASNLIKSLIKRRLIITQKGELDRRAICLYLSAEGSAVLDHAPAPFTGVLPLALANLDQQTLARLEQDLHQLILALDVDESSAKTPLANL